MLRLLLRPHKRAQHICSPCATPDVCGSCGSHECLALQIHLTAACTASCSWCSAVCFRMLSALLWSVLFCQYCLLFLQSSAAATSTAIQNFLTATQGQDHPFYMFVSGIFSTLYCVCLCTKTFSRPCLGLFLAIIHAVCLAPLWLYLPRFCLMMQVLFDDAD